MAKKTKKDVQPEAAVEAGQQEQAVKAEEQKAPKLGIVTTEGNTIDTVKVYPSKDGEIMVQAHYGKLKEGKTSEERRAGMHQLISRPLTAEQAKEYQRLNKENPAAAKEYAVSKAFPMHYDDASFHQKDTTINGRHVDYIVLEKLKAENLDEKNKHLAGRWQISFGEKGKADTRFYGLLNNEELASIRHRAEIKLDGKGKIASIGSPMSMADIAGKAEQRIVAQRQAAAERRQVADAKVAAAKQVDWSQFKFPEGAEVKGLHFSPVKSDPDRVWLNGTLNGMKVFAMLTPEETTAMRNKLATLTQVGAANKEFSSKVATILSAAPSQGVSLADAVKAVVDRASDPAAKAFTPEQSGTIIKYLGDIDGDGRMDVAEELWGKAKEELDGKGVNEAWQKDAHEELKDLSQGTVRENQQQMHR